jgi:hypothetical protein
LMFFLEWYVIPLIYRVVVIHKEKTHGQIIRAILYSNFWD